MKNNFSKHLNNKIAEKPVIINNQLNNSLNNQLNQNLVNNKLEKFEDK